MNGHIAERERVLAGIRHDVAERLRGVCIGWPESDFASLVDRIAQIKYKYDAPQLDHLFAWTSPRHRESK